MDDVKRRFEWDENKAASNYRKHGVPFNKAMHVFKDPFARATPDRIENGEERWQTIGHAGDSLLLLVAHTLWSDEEETEVVRIISARRADKKERRIYEDGKLYGR